ncbi:MAG: hypothetical protein PHQ20_01335 [Candidatus Moranbacteria bacterium]|jgi:hypothetical protein|nr:hypothetical protein [Candidatus Moranbacteria bacterium]
MEKFGRQIVLLVKKSNEKNELFFFEEVEAIYVFDIEEMLASGLAEIVIASNESLPKLSPGARNLRENPEAAKAFWQFLLMSLGDWQEKRRRAGESARLCDFARSINLNTSSWHRFVKNPTEYGLSVTKAKEICQRLGTTLEGALKKGVLR